MTTQQENNALDALMEHLNTLVDQITLSLDYHENRRQLLWALGERAGRELNQSEHDRNWGLQDDAAEAKGERHREERQLQQAA